MEQTGQAVAKPEIDKARWNKGTMGEMDMSAEQDKGRGILLASFGTSYPETRQKTLGRIEAKVRETYPELPVWRAWTSGMIRRKILERDGEMILSPQEALSQMADAGIRKAVILPTHLLAGFEYEKLVEAVTEMEPCFERISMGRPLLDSNDDCDRMLGAVMREIPLDTADALVLMGHGTEHTVNKVYETLNERLGVLGYANVYLGTVEAAPGFDAVLARVQAQHPKRVILAPFLFVAGDHATNDLAGDDADSWKSRFAAAGYPVECVGKGLGEYVGVRGMLMERLAQLLAL